MVQGFMVDLSSKGVTDEIQLGVIPTTMGTFLMHIIAAIIEKAILYSTLSKVCMVLSQQIVYMAMFSRSVIRIKTIRNWHGVYVFPICKLAINRFMSSSNQECTRPLETGENQQPRLYIKNWVCVPCARVGHTLCFVCALDFNKTSTGITICAVLQS